MAKAGTSTAKPPKNAPAQAAANKNPPAPGADDQAQQQTGAGDNGAQPPATAATTTAAETPPAAPAAAGAKVKLETVAEKVTTLGDHLVAAAENARVNADHAAHGALENFIVHLQEFKARFASVEGKLEGEAAALFARVKKLL